MRKLLIVTFLATVSVNAVGAAPHLEAQACAMKCCDKLRKLSDDNQPARLRCVTSCDEPVGANPTRISAPTLAPQKHASTTHGRIYRYRAVSYIERIKFPTSPTRFIAGSTDRYLEIGALLI